MKRSKKAVSTKILYLLICMIFILLLVLFLFGGKFNEFLNHIIKNIDKTLNYGVKNA